eukprot:1136345-Pelagomonas_calceolata.AAC.7
MVCFPLKIPSSEPALCTLAMPSMKLSAIWLVAAFILPSRLRRTPSSLSAEFVMKVEKGKESSLHVSHYIRSLTVLKNVVTCLRRAGRNVEATLSMTQSCLKSK